MDINEQENNYTYIVVKNHEDQYSIWPDFKSIPAGWDDMNQRGSKQECLDYIKSVWTDMRPRSLREAMDKNKNS